MDLKPHEADEAAVAFARRCASLLVVLPGHPAGLALFTSRCFEVHVKLFCSQNTFN
jgi:hypothetical protein